MLPWLRRSSLRARLGALVALAVGVTIALASLAAYFAVRHELYGQVDSTLENQLSSVISANSDQGISVGQAVNILLHSNSLFQINLSDGTVVPIPEGRFSSQQINPGLPADPSGRALAQSDGRALRTITFNKEPYRVLAVGATFDGTTPAVIQIARPLTDVIHSLQDLRLILWLVNLGGIGVAIGLGYLVGKVTIRPVERLTAAAEHVALTQDLEARIDDTGKDELARLGHSFNEMLAALAASRRQQAQLVSDAGHELRTPLTSLRTNIEVLLRVPDLPEADRSALTQDVQGQLEELTTLIGDVVELARSDEQQTDPIEVRLDSVVDQAVHRARRRASGLVFDTHLTPGSIRAQPALLERAILNVLDNAAKWSPPGGTVGVWLRREDRWMLDVSDQGPGISAADLPHVFDRFYRADSARSLPGSGLGLAIVRQVVSASGGSVSAYCPEGGGTVIHIELPIVSETEPDPVNPYAPPVPDEAFAPTPDAPSASATGPAVERSSDGADGNRPSTPGAANGSVPDRSEPDSRSPADAPAWPEPVPVPSPPGPRTANDPDAAWRPHGSNGETASHEGEKPVR